MPDPGFNQAMQAMVDASGGLLRRGGNDRSMDEQIALRKKNGCPDVWRSPASACRIPTAIPGRSWHQHGFAEDVIDASTGKVVQAGSAADQWLAANAARFGLHRPVGAPGKKGWEPWHVEPVNIDRSRMRELRNPDDIGFDVDRQGRPGSPEDELSARLDAFRKAIRGETDTTAIEAPTPQMRTETTTTPQTMKTPFPLSGAQRNQGQVTYNPRGGVDQWRPLVIQALQLVGEPTSEANVTMTLRRMKQESGGNPTIVNNWDVNAKRGTPSIGLMQVIKPTFDRYAGEFQSRGQTDPLANLVASMRYAKARYGTLASAYNRRGGY